MATSRRLTSGRARRAIKMGELASQVGTSYLWTSMRRLFVSADAHQRELLETHIRNARRIVEGSQQLRGAFMKLIQMLAMRRDLLPGPAIDLLQATHSSVPPMDYATIAEQVRRELGKRPEALFRSFEREAFAAASLGQVHRARLFTGEEVAVKIQYPGVADTVEQDLGNLKLLLGTLGAIARDVMRQKIDTATIFAELRTRLKEELDYGIEARNLSEFGRLFADDPEVMIPRAIGELSSRRVLTMSYVEGYPLADVFSPRVDAELRRWVALKLYRMLWRQILEFGVLHTDPHPGNYLVSHHPRIGLLDFGSIRRLPEPIRKGCLALARALIARDDRAIAEAMVKLGFLSREQDAAPMVQVVHTLFEPMLTDRAYDPAEYDSMGKLAKVGEMAVEHKLYRSPAYAVFVIRALVGLDGILQQLRIKANYRAIFRECIEAASGRNSHSGT